MRYPDLLDALWADGYPGGRLDSIASSIYESSPLFKQMPWLPASGPSGHRGVRRDGSRRETVRQGAGSTRWIASSKNKEITDEEFEEVVRATARALGQQFSGLIFWGRSRGLYGDFTCLNDMFSTLDIGKALSAKNVTDAGGTEESTLFSIWLIDWSEDVCVRYNPRFPAGLRREEMTRVPFFFPADTALESSDGAWPWKAELIGLEAAITCSNWKSIQRIVNVSWDIASDKLSALIDAARYRNKEARLYVPEHLHRRLDDCHRAFATPLHGSCLDQRDVRVA